MKKSTKFKAMLVEDDLTLARIYKTKLTKSGFDVLHVCNGKECLEKASEFKPDIILLDVIIPRLDGFAVLQELKSNSRTRKIPVIMLTNLAQNEDMEKGKKLGACNYLVKSNLTPAELIKKVEAVLKS
ncbi:MAG: response regulator [Patescibacteria group bacterium]